MVQLTTQQVYIPVQVPTPPPASSLSLPKPVSYEFRVAEYTKDGKITKVRLQVQTWEHDQYGAGVVIQPWKDVERIPLVDID